MRHFDGVEQSECDIGLPLLARGEQAD